MTSDTAKIIKRSIFAAFFGMAMLSSAIATNTAVTAASSGTQRPYTSKCPIDDTVSNYVNSEFSGITEIGVYEHALVGGGVQTRQLAEPGRDRDQLALPSVPGAAENPIPRTTEPTSTSLEPENEPRPSHHQLAVYALKGTPEVRLQQKQIHTVRDLGTSLFGTAQSEVPVEIQIQHLNQCTALMQQWNDLYSGVLSVEQQMDFEKGTLSFGSDSENLKYQMLHKVGVLEEENGTYDLKELKRKLLMKKLEVMRNIESECSDVDRDKGTRSIRLNEIGDTLTNLDQAEDAIPILRRCIALDPDYASCSASLGSAFQALGRESEAISVYKRTIEIGGFSKRNADAIEYARHMVAILESRDAASKEVAESKEAKPVQHSFGTGFFVSSDGEILTNNHVVAGCRNLTIKEGQTVQVISRDPASDLALVKADHKPDEIAVFRSGPAPRIGDTVVIFGFPLPGILSSEGNVSTGILSATTGLQNDIRFVQISAPVQPGNSGGPVFDTSGHVIGVVVAKLDALRVAQFTGDVPQNVNFAVHWSEVRALLDEQGVKYKKLPSQQAISTRAIAKIGAEVSVTLDCTQ